ncbi:GFA family protein [Bradyrhizobium altum]|uniref:GFA family protein n=1 Tax=Bradyrhizobium altum TaxID=1571202 RepID=UPI00289A6FC5|nr:GFA family protein [Bradyrhizobium altum]
MMTRLATCACGQLRVTCHREPGRVSLCHCLECQKRTGSTYGVAAFFQRADVEPHGETREYSRVGDSGSAVLFHFCPDCGTTVYWEPRRARSSSRLRSVPSRTRIFPRRRSRSSRSTVIPGSWTGERSRLIRPAGNI